MKKLVLLVTLEIVSMTALGVWLTTASTQDSKPKNAFTAVSYLFVGPR